MRRMRIHGISRLHGFQYPNEEQENPAFESGFLSKQTQLERIETRLLPEAFCLEVDF